MVKFFSFISPLPSIKLLKKTFINLLSRTKSALQPLLSEVSTRTAELRDFESAINAKKQELERVSKKLEEVSSTLRCESLVFFVINKSLFILSPLILSTFIFSATWTTSQHLLVATRQLFSPCLLVHTYIL